MGTERLRPPIRDAAIARVDQVAVVCIFGRGIFGARSGDVVFVAGQVLSVSCLTLLFLRFGQF
jgi:hypothetical protein